MGRLIRERAIELLDIIRQEKYAAKLCKPCSAEYHAHMKKANDARKEYNKLRQ